MRPDEPVIRIFMRIYRFAVEMGDGRWEMGDGRWEMGDIGKF
jgi:hypothetical protein